MADERMAFGATETRRNWPEGGVSVAADGVMRAAGVTGSHPWQAEQA
jgi:hypothetical protein